MDHLRKVANLKAADCVVVWAAINLAFFFVRRASEYLVHLACADSVEKVFLGVDVAVRLNNKGKLLFKNIEVVL